MIYKLIDSFGSGDFGFNNGKFYFVDKNFIKTDDKTIMLSDYLGIEFYGSLINVFTNDSRSKFYDYNGNFLVEFENKNFYYIFSKDSFIFYDRKDKQTKFNDVFIFEDKTGCNFVNNNEYYFYYKNDIHCVLYSTGKLNWQFSTSNLPIYETSSGEQKHPTVKKFIGVWENQLLVECNRGIILFLDITTGELLHTLDLNADSKDGNSDHLDASTYYISINTSLNKLIILAPAFLYHFDLKLKNLSVIKDYLNVEISEKWNFKSATFVDDLIYFTGDYGQQYVVATRVGVLNSQTGEVLWQTQLEKTGGLNTAPQVAGDKLYVLSQKNVLYIFEKER